MSEREELNDGTGSDVAPAPATEDVSVAGNEASAPVATDIVASASQATGDGPVVESVAVVPTGTAVAAETAAPRRKTQPVKPSTLQPLPPYAIIETGGKQYRVSVGDVVSVEKLPVDAGSSITFDRVLLLGGNGDTRVGKPTVDGASVAATVEETYRGEKLVIFKYKAKKHYRRKMGHRQSLTRLAITAINA